MKDDAMNTAFGPGRLILMSGSPAQVPELAPAEEASRQLASLSARAVAEACARVGAPVELVTSRAERWYTGHSGSFRAWGAPQVKVSAGHHLPELVARHVLESAGVSIASARGRIGALNPEAVTVLVLDGSAGMTARAPLALLDGAAAAHEALLGLLDAQDLALDSGALAAAGVLEPELWLELAALRPESAQIIYQDTHLGVGRYLASWQVGGAN